MKHSYCLLLLADRRQSHTASLLKSSGYRLMMSYTPDHAVALCVNNEIDAVVLDQQHFVVTDGWSVAQSIKLIKPRICVLLIVRGKVVSKVLPEAIDAIIQDSDRDGLLKTLEKLL